MMEAAAIGGAGQVITSLIGASAQADARRKAEALIQQTVQELENIGVPTADALQVALDKYRSAGVLTPELEQTITQGDTELKGIETDPRLASAEMDALNELRSLGDGGFSISDKAALQDSLTQSNNQERGNREAILLDAAQRGASTGGGAIAAQLLNQQGGATRGNQAALDTASKGYDRALQAIIQSGQLAGEMQGRQFGQKAQTASAQDVINAMNTQAMQGVQQRNVGTQNQVQEKNLNNAQNIMNSNTDIGNQQTMYNAQVPQQVFENSLNKANAVGNARGNQANSMIQGGKDTAAMWGGIGSALGKGGASYADYLNKKKEEV